VSPVDRELRDSGSDKSRLSYAIPELFVAMLVVIGALAPRIAVRCQLSANRRLSL
jgi:hypothetical protein